MAIGLTEEHEQLAESVRGLVGRHLTSQAVRNADDGGLRAALAAQGLPGLHLPERYGG
ncbi:MAG: acyl-CoA dehydrogenase family protein, partial [Actinomadura rubrobrunea]|nr:acyl-CoA dehydrogenase family protein [Actinomadura rubrobrunea]